MTSRHTITLPAAVAALLLTGSMAVAPSAAPAQATQATPPAKTQDLSDEQLKSFAAATLEVEDLNQKWSPRIAEAKEPSEQESIRRQAMGEMAQAVRDEGLTVQGYNEISKVVQADPETAQTVEAYRAEMR